MKAFILAGTFALLTVSFASLNAADDAAYIVPNPHGGYNTIQGTNKQKKTAPVFGKNSLAAQEREHPSYHRPFILRPVTKDDGHGKPMVVYEKVYTQ